jgi:general secretion pathway protein K
LKAQELTTLQRLCETLGLPAQVAQTIADGLRRSTLGSTGEVSGDAATASTGNAGQGAMPLAPQTVAQLTWLGIDAATIQRLAPHVVLLPQPTPVNLNTAGREVIAAVLTTVDLAAAQRLVQARQRSPLKKLEDVRSVLGENLAGLDAQRVDIKSNYFEVQGTMRLELLTVAQRSLIERRNRDVRVLRTERVRLSPDVGPATNAGVNSLQQ